MAVKTIVLRGDGIRKEGIAAAAVTPGMLIERTATLTIQAQSTAGAQAQRAFAVENEVVGLEIDTAYVALDTLIYEVLPPGAEVYGWIDEENITKGDLLVATGDGSLKGVSTPGIVPTSTGVLVDADAAATNGLLVYLHTDVALPLEGTVGHLESVTAGNANADWKVGASGPSVIIHDDDAAATAGFIVYFDEDATDPDSRYLHTSTLVARDVFVLLSDGSFLRIAYHATASAVGVAIYFDDDAATADIRMEFVSPTDTDGSYTTDDSVSMRAYTGPESVLAMALETVANSGGGAIARCKVEVI